MIATDADPIKIGQEALYRIEVGIQRSGLLLQCESSSLTYQLDLGRLETTKDDSIGLGKYTFRSIETLAIGLSEQLLCLGKNNPK